jgi:predicted GNAT family N-acyltransferase
MGYGSALLNYRIEMAFDVCSDFPITIDTTQHTKAFFEKFGFRSTNTTENYYATGLHRIDMVKLNRITYF